MRRVFNRMVWSIFLVLSSGLTVYSLIEIQERRAGVYYVDEENKLPDELHPTVEDKKNQLIEEAADEGIDVVITDEVRSIEEQDEIYERGRSREGDIVTNAEGGESYHNYGLAVDFALRTEEGNLSWNTERDGNQNGQADWEEAAEIAKSLGFEWGGDWESFRDYPHLQMDFGLSVRELQNGKRPKAEPLDD
ncbi:M15 family metallopeptidase [Halobacillus sp. A5]|nr:M15 family metallopeptidase [Halobacillus sp. A5]MCP3029083.1 M15 family metallopeptidase [Halobacillus sp. A5]